jgi:hypothetical protein
VEREADVAHVRIESEMRFEHAINRPSEFARSPFSLFECAPLVGWVERSDTHHAGREVMGFASLYPSYEVCDFCLRRHRLRDPALLPR